MTTAPTDNPTTVSSSPDEQDNALPKTVRAWAQLRRTPPWLLALVVTFMGWSVEQENEQVDEMLGTDFDAAVAECQKAYDLAVANNGGKKKTKVLMHNDLLVAVVVRRLRPTEETAVSSAIGEATEAGSREGAAKLLSHFQQCIIFPDAGKWAAARDQAPKAFNFTLPQKWQGSLGLEIGDVAKKQ